MFTPERKAEQKAESERDRVVMMRLKYGDEHPEVVAWAEAHPGEPLPEVAVEEPQEALVPPGVVAEPLIPDDNPEGATVTVNEAGPTPRKRESGRKVNEDGLP